MGLTDDGLAAYHFDCAVWTFGTEVDEALRQAVEPRSTGRKTKPLSAGQQQLAVATVLEQWLGIAGLKRYKDPAGQVGKR